MKTLLMTISFLFAAMAGTRCASYDKGNEVTEVRKVEAFSSIQVTAVASVYFTQGSAYSLKIQGKEKLVNKIKISVNNGLLSIDSERDKNGNINGNNGVDIYITAPDLKSVDFTGVGSFNCKTPLKLNDVKFTVEGVGKLKVDDLKCKSLNVDLQGVGKADIHAQMQSRLTEIAVRKAYGASNVSVVGRLFSESLLTTVMGGIAGYLLSCLLVWSGRTWLFGTGGVDLSGIALDGNLLLRPALFFAVLGLCLVFNLLSVGLPAWIAVHRSIASTLKGE